MIPDVQNAEHTRLLDSSAGAASSYGTRSDAVTETMVEETKPSTPAKTFTQYIAALAATGGALAAGTMLGWTSPTEIFIVDQNNTGFVGEYGFIISKDEWSWIGSASTLGAAAMCLTIGTIINVIGRKLTMLLLVIPFIIGWALVVWATNFETILIGRIFLGIAGGSFCITAPVYTGEIAQKEIRGALGSYFQLMVTVGILFVYAVGAGVNVFILSIICGIIPIVFGVIFVFMPETPQYWVSKNKNEDAIKSLKWLRGKEYDYNSELIEMQDENEKRRNENVSIIRALMRRSSIKAIFIGIGLMFFQQMSGVNAVIFYTGFIFNAADTGLQGSYATIIVGVMQVLATLGSTFVVDKLGRRVLLLISVSVMAICTILLGVFFFLSDSSVEGEDSQVANLGWLPILSLSLFIIAFSIGFGPIPWLMMGELFAADIKGVAGSVAGAFNWLLAFVITKTFNDLSREIGIGETFWVFSGFSVLGIVFVFFLVPETKGKSLSDIQRMLSGEKDIIPTTNGTSGDEKS